MQRTLAPALAAATLLALAACQSNPARVHADADADATLLEPITALVGDWEGQHPETGEWMPAAHFEITGGGSAVCDTMIPGTPMQMTNLYHMDGDQIVCTHYCAAGNQPRMVASKAKKTDAGLVYKFDLDTVSNLRPDHDHYMGYMILTIANDGTLQQEWRSYDRDHNLTEPMTFVLRRAN